MNHCNYVVLFFMKSIKWHLSKSPILTNQTNFVKHTPSVVFESNEIFQTITLTKVFSFIFIVINLFHFYYIYFYYYSVIQPIITLLFADKLFVQHNKYHELKLRILSSFLCH